MDRIHCPAPDHGCLLGACRSAGSIHYSHSGGWSILSWRNYTSAFIREAMEAALIHRKPMGIIVDEAHHLAKAASGRRLQDQLDHLKYFENMTGVSHILVGTYEMRPFRMVNAQLACRSIDVHFPRYDAAKEEDVQLFQSALWALQRQLPVEEEPLLAEQSWEFLYARSIGCIGLLKLHLNRALGLPLSEGAKSLNLRPFQQTALPEASVP